MQYPQIRTASLSFSVCTRSGTIVQYPQIGTSSLSFSVCVHSGTIAEYPQIRTASLSFIVCVLSGIIVQYPQIGTSSSSLSFSVCSFRNHCSVPSNQDSFIVIQYVCSFRSHCAVPSNQDSFAVIQCVFIQEPLCSTFKSGQLPCVCVHSGTIVQYPKIMTASMPLTCIHSGAIMQYPQIGSASLSFSVCSFRSHCAIPSDRDCFPVIQCLFSFRNHCAVPSKQRQLPCVCAHSGPVVKYPQIRTASLPFNMRLFRNQKDCAEGDRNLYFSSQCVVFSYRRESVVGIDS